MEIKNRLMKNIIKLSVVLTAILLWIGCNKKDSAIKGCSYTQNDLDNVYAPASEVNALAQFIIKDSIDAIQDPRGFYYKIDTSGTYSRPAPCANITINYVGTLTSGKVFDQGKNIQFNLGSLLLGWKMGLPLIGKNGKMTLFLPPSFAYGSNEINGIPPNSILIFSIELINFSNP